MLRLRVNIDTLVVDGRPFGPPCISGWTLYSGGKTVAASAGHRVLPDAFISIDQCVELAVKELQLRLPFD